jgi:hypothetical protein
VSEKEIQQRVNENEKFYDFDIAKESFYNQHIDEKIKNKKYIYEPCYLNFDRSKPEREFENFLEENEKNIFWWWKNGDNKKDYLGIKYEYPKDHSHTFYPDYLVQFSNGSIGIFEVKDKRDQEGSTITKAKAEAFQSYFKNQNNKNLFGGIVIQVNKEFLINKKVFYNWEKTLHNDWSDWETLKL